MDVVYPLVYALLFSFILFMLHQDIRIAKFPFLSTIIDYLENAGVVTMLLNYPNELHGVARITGIFTTSKWTALVITVLLII